MRTDRELLELAAKAAGIEKVLTLGTDDDGFMPALNLEFDFRKWNPLDDDGDALRLAVKVLNWPHGGRAFENAVSAMYAVGQLPKVPYAATRRAIVRAAAEIGRSM